MTLLFLLILLVPLVYSSAQEAGETISWMITTPDFSNKNTKLSAVFKENLVPSYSALQAVPTVDPNAFKKAAKDIKLLFRNFQDLFMNKDLKTKAIPVKVDTDFFSEFKYIQKMDPNNVDVDDLIYNTAKCLLKLKSHPPEIEFVGNFDTIIRTAIRILAESTRNFDKWPADKKADAKAIFEACGVNLGLQPWQTWSIAAGASILFFLSFVVYIVRRRRSVIKHSNEEEFN
jgi:hypothetical protein